MCCVAAEPSMKDPYIAGVMTRATKRWRRVFLVAVVLLGAMVIYSFSTSITCHVNPAGCTSSDKMALFGNTRLDFVDARRHMIKEHEEALQRNETIIKAPVKHPLVYKPEDVPVYDSYAEAVKARASEENLIILASLDQGYVDMALNLWETSFLKLNIDNFLFVCTDEQAVVLMKDRGLPCFLGFQVKSKASVSIYGSAAFKEKTHIKTKIILEALELGYDVLIVDVDIVFLKNPLPYFDCDDCDIQIQNDGPEINSGFYYVRPTKPSVKLHADALELAHKSRGLSNQQCLNRIIGNMKKRHDLKVKVLSDKFFPRGNIFYEKGKRMFADDQPCEECVIVHDNWIVGGAAKIYRLKEFTMWMIDNNGYYSSNSTKYLMYNNLVKFSGKDATVKAEAESLKAALTLGRILNRKVILPAFHCDGCKQENCRNPKGRCSLNTHFRIKTFDKFFSNDYREHMFFKHPKVPDNVKNSVSPIYLIESHTSQSYKSDSSFKTVKVDQTYTPADLEDGPSQQEITQWFKNSETEKFKVLRYHSLYVAYKQLNDAAFSKILSDGIQPAVYRQY